MRLAPMARRSAHGRPPGLFHRFAANRQRVFLSLRVDLRLLQRARRVVCLPLDGTVQYEVDTRSPFVPRKSKFCAWVGFRLGFPAVTDGCPAATVGSNLTNGGRSPKFGREMPNEFPLLVSAVFLHLCPNCAQELKKKRDEKMG